MLKNIHLANNGHVLELGPGTGAFTKCIAGHLTDHKNYLGIELDKQFVQTLQLQFPQLNFAHGSAEYADRYMGQAGMSTQQLTAIVSGLPFACLPHHVQDNMIDTLNRLMGSHTVFRTFQYLHCWPLPRAARFRNRMNKLFQKCQVTDLVFRNMPPALVLSWQR